MAGAMTPVTPGEGTALKGPPGDQCESAEHTAVRRFSTPVCAPERRTMSGLSSSVQVPALSLLFTDALVCFIVSVTVLSSNLMLLRVPRNPRGECGYRDHPQWMRGAVMGIHYYLNTMAT